MLNNIIFCISKFLCICPYKLTNQSEFTYENSSTYRTRFYLLLTTFCFISSYVRIYHTIINLLATQNHLTLNNYIYLTNALITIIIVCLQMTTKLQQAERLVAFLNQLKAVNSPPQIHGHTFQLIFLVFIVIMLLFVNIKTHNDWRIATANFLNETFIEMVCFLNTFEYFNLLLLLRASFVSIRVQMRPAAARTLWKLYLQQCDLCRDFDELYRCTTSAVIAYAFIWIVFDAYICLDIISRRVYKGWWDFIRGAPWVILHSLKLVIILAVPAQCKAAANVVRPLVFTERMRLNCKEIFDCYLRMLDKRVDYFAQSKIFSMSYLLLPSMFGTVVTYLVILYGFTKESEDI